MHAIEGNSGVQECGRPLAAFGWSLALGVFWMLIEFTQIFAASTLFHFPTDMGRLIRYLPWQLGAFAAIGLPLALLVRFRGLRRASACWLRFGAALFAFGASPAALGVYRASRSPAQAIAVALVIAVSIGFALVAIASLRRALPRRLGAGWAAACVIGGSIAFVPVLSRASAPLSLGRLPFTKLIAMVEPIDCVAGLVATIVTLIVRWRVQRNSSSAVAAILVAFTLTAAEPLNADTRMQSALTGQPDVVVVLIDALRADSVGSLRHGKSITPNLDALATESIVFQRAYSAANRTAHSMPAIMTSLSADVVGESLSHDATTLAEYLHATGYRTYGISTNPYVSAFYSYDQGFDRFHDPTVSPDYLIAHPLKLLDQLFPAAAYRYGWISAHLYYSPAGEVRARATRVLRDTESPRFLYLHLMDLHGPYLPPKADLPPDYREADFASYYRLVKRSAEGELDSQEESRALVNSRQRYEAGLRYADREIGRLIETLRDSGRLDNTLIWILSDHGEAFGEHGWFGHSGSNVYSTLLHVPMILKLPLAARAKREWIAEPTSTLDVLPTTLSALGIEVPSEVFGIDLLGRRNNARFGSPRVVISDSYHPDGRLLSAIEDAWQLVALRPRHSSNLEKIALHHLERDPATQVNLIGQQPEIEDRLTKALIERRIAEQQFTLRSRPREVDPEMVERLRSLGYIDE